MKILNIAFYSTTSNLEPVKQWLLKLSNEDKKHISQEIKTVKYGWPQIMPVVKTVDQNLWEMRIRISTGRLAKIFLQLKKRI